jgi:SOS-response transcriptional repressor LexA
VLEPANPDYPPTLVRDMSQFVVLGRVIGIIRQIRLPIAATAIGAADGA